MDKNRPVWYQQSAAEWKVKTVSMNQRAKEVMSDSPGLVDFAIGLVIFVLYSPNGQVLFSGEIQITEGL